MPQRAREVARLRRILLRLHSPRVHMGAIVALTGLSGLLCSFVLLHAGMHEMWLRYPLSVAVAYVVFLLMIWIWLRLRDSALDVADAVDVVPGPGGSREPVDAWSGGGGHSGGGGASASFGEPRVEADLSPAELEGVDLPGGLDLDEGIFVVIAIALVASAALVAGWLVWAAPTLLAEILFDAALSAGLYRRLKHLQAEHWVFTAVRRTGWQFLLVAVFFTVLGAAIQSMVPGADSIGDALR